MMHKDLTKALGVCASVAVLVLFSRPSQAQNGPTTLTIRGDLCAEVNEEIEVEIRMTRANAQIAGGQFFVAFSIASLELVDVQAGFPPSAFSALLYRDACLPGVPLLGTPECTQELEKHRLCCTRRDHVDVGVGLRFGLPPTSADSVMAVLLFRVTSQDSARYVVFRRANEHPTLLATTSTGVFPILIDAVSNAKDQLDYSDFQNCFSGPNSEAITECQLSFDLDPNGGDGDVDNADFNLFKSEYMGPETIDCP
jgi:hypothetical protein